MTLEQEFRQQINAARKSLAEKAPDASRPDGLSEDEFERLVFETTPIGLLELWVARLAREVDELRAAMDARDRDSEAAVRTSDEGQ